MSSDKQKVLTYDNINPNVKTMEYAVRGPIVIRAVEIEKELAQVISLTITLFNHNLGSYSLSI
jgi:alanine transaminase